MIKQLRLLFSITCLASILAACSSSPITTPVIPTLTSTVVPSPAPTLTPTPTLPPTDVWLSANDVQVYPAGILYDGDRISFRITVHNNSQATLFHVPVEVQAGDRSFDSNLGSITAGDTASTDLTWVWDTTSLIGDIPITVTIDPSHTLEVGDNNRSNDVASLQIDLHPIDTKPLGERTAKWDSVSAKCCRIHYISGTAVERDIAAIKQTIDDALAYVTKQMRRSAPPRLDVYLVDRVLGQGGLANNVVIISYLDRNYARGEFSQVMRHELTHILDRSRLRGYQPLFLLEGYAVLTTGGHYRPENVAVRAASLVDTDKYLPLNNLIDNFYPSQHEAAYAEAAAFLQYLVERFGAAKFDRFYTELSHQPAETDSELIDRRLRQAFNVGLADLEQDWQTWLRTQPVTASDRSNLLATMSLYDAIRQYEQQADSSAYLLSFWIPDIQTAEARGITADYQRHPERPENIALETMLIAADQFLSDGDYISFDSVLASITQTLDHDLRFDDPLAAQYLAIVKATVADGYEPQAITIKNNQAEVIATRGDSTLIRLVATLRVDRDQWTLQLAN